jgi:hypothetical protein
MEPIHYGPAYIVPNTVSVQGCRIYRGPHWVGELQTTGHRYFVMGLYHGDPIRNTTSRDEVRSLVAQVAAQAPMNPKDCNPLVCQH